MRSVNKQSAQMLQWTTDCITSSFHHIAWKLSNRIRLVISKHRFCRTYRRQLSWTLNVRFSQVMFCYTQAKMDARNDVLSVCDPRSSDPWRLLDQCADVRWSCMCVFKYIRILMRYVAFKEEHWGKMCHSWPYCRAYCGDWFGTWLLSWMRAVAR